MNKDEIKDAQKNAIEFLGLLRKTPKDNDQLALGVMIGLGINTGATIPCEDKDKKPHTVG